MKKHISYFILKKNHKNFKKGTKTKIRKDINSFFEISKKNGTKIQFREDKWNPELFEPIYHKLNLKSLQKNLLKEYNALLEFKLNKLNKQFGLNIVAYFNWEYDSNYSLNYFDVKIDLKICKTKESRELGQMLSYELSDNYEFIESLFKSEVKAGNKKIQEFLDKCNRISEEVGFDVFNTYLIF